jgi:hypothetical protein
MRGTPEGLRRLACTVRLEAAAEQAHDLAREAELLADALEREAVP